MSFSLNKAKPESHDSSCLTSHDAVELAQKMKKELLEQLEDLSEDLPPNTLDELIDELGGPENVAEVQITLQHDYTSCSVLTCTFVTCSYSREGDTCICLTHSSPPHTFRTRSKDHILPPQDK